MLRTTQSGVRKLRTKDPFAQAVAPTTDVNVAILPVVTEDLPISPWFTPYDFLSRCKFSTLTTRQPMAMDELYSLAYSLFSRP